MLHTSLILLYTSCGSGTGGSGVRFSLILLRKPLVRRDRGDTLSLLVQFLLCLCMYVGWRELLTQHDSPAGVTAYFRSARATAWRNLCFSLPVSPSAFRRSDRS